MKEIQQILDKMEPEEALAELVPSIKKIISHLDEEAKVSLVAELIGGPNKDKISSMVNLWLAECMDEGVDPTHMCQNLVNKVAQSKQLMAITDPDILVLFESWLDELEEEMMLFINEHPNLDSTELAENLGLSKSGASFLIAKLQREEKI